MDNAVAAWVGAALLLAIIIPLRLAIQSQRGTLDWRRERPVLIAAPLFLFVAAALLASGPVVRVVGPPVVLSVGGGALTFYGAHSPARLGPLTLREFGFVVFVVGGLGVVIAVIRAFAG